MEQRPLSPALHHGHGLFLFPYKLYTPLVYSQQETHSCPCFQEFDSDDLDFDDVDLPLNLAEIFQPSRRPTVLLFPAESLEKEGI